MHLYNLTLQAASASPQAIVGNFSGQRHQEIIVSRGTRLELLKPDPATGKLASVLTHDVFGSIRSLAVFRLTGGVKDYAIVGSDSGRIVILDYDPKANAFTKVHQETYGKSGARRVVAGQYLAVDPKGRAVMIAAMEKSKLVYILNRDAATNLTISSPLEAHRNQSIIFHICGVDVGFENPLFAALEIDYGEVDQDATGEAFHNADKMLTFYELDLGLNHVVRKWSEPTDPRANFLIQVPGGTSASSPDKFDGPSGVLVCCENHIIYRHMDHPQHRVPIPRRRAPLDSEDRGIIIVAGVMHKMKGAFFFLLQSEEGDLFKVTIDHQEDEVLSLKIKYFDTIPVAASLCILKSGYLFCASEFGPHHLYQFQKLGDDDAEMEFSSTSYPQHGMRDPNESLPNAHFQPRPLDNLLLCDTLDSVNPIIDAKVLNLMPTISDTPQFYVATGRGARSSFRLLRHGLEVEENISTDLPSGIPNAVWTTKLKADDEFDTYIVLSFVNGTLVLTIGETIEECQETGFLSAEPTLAVQQIGDDALLQVSPHGIRHILSDQRVNVWKVPDGKTIVQAATNSRQVVVALNSAELVYFELDLDGQLNEYQDRKAMGSVVLALSMAEVPEGRQRTPYLAVGCEDQTVRLISLDPDNTLETISLQALTAPPSAICIIEMVDSSINKTQATLFVNIGLTNGLFLRTVLDPVTGELTDTRTRFLGTRPIRLNRVVVAGKPALLALSSRMWLNYVHQDSLRLTPLIFDSLDYVSGFSASLCQNGFIGLKGSTIKIFQIPNVSQRLKHEVLPLSYTPRNMAVHPTSGLFYVAEADHRVYGTEAINAALQDSELKKYDRDLSTVFRLDLDNNEAAFSIALVPFSAREGETLLVVGTAKDTFLAPRSCTSGFLRAYKLVDDGRSLELLHKTETEDVPLSLLAFQGKLVAGIGPSLRIYEMGKRKLLRKAETKLLTTAITSLSTQGSRIIAGDAQQSIFYCVYKAPENRLMVFADDTQPRWTTAHVMLDYNTVAAADKFGNVFVNRITEHVSNIVDEDPTGAGLLHEKNQFMGAPHKSATLAHFHVGDVITSLHRTPLVPGGREIIIYFGLHGTIGMLVPMVSKEDVDFFTTLEQHMRSENLSLVGRDILSWRGYYVPVKSVVDGDLCEFFARLPPGRQSNVAAELDRTVGEVLKKLEMVRVNASGF
ncbi:CPSF A subunit region-domain-containing protein [Auriculariales sp. MPI-PUGE-AT-0066]|nr:CPSF A subunit region-domain-containing protein [Auriculariales sp. MPI-PUGE-AT-0066]